MSIRHIITSSLLLACAFAKAQDQLVVTEIQVANIDQFIDNSYNYGGWIELYNPTDTEISLKRWYLSDDESNPKKVRLSVNYGSIPAKSYHVMYFDHHSSDGLYGPYAYKQANLKLDPEGGVLYLADNLGNPKLSFSYPEAISRCSYARLSPNSYEWNWSPNPTPGKANDGMIFTSRQLASPQLNMESGILSTSRRLQVTCPEGSQLVYTTDGSTPTLANGTKTSVRVFTIDKTSVWRFRVFKEGYLPSEVITRSFIFKDKDYTLPIVSVVTDPDNLYDDSIGVYTIGVNGATGRGINYKSNKNMDWERPVNVDYILPDGTSAINQEATFYISGGWSRHWDPTSFKLKAEKRYQLKNYFDYPLFPLKPYNKNKVVVMRNGGNDTACRAKDAVIQRIIQTSGFYVDGQDWNPCHVFINGKYHAMLNMREPNNKHFATANYGIDTDEMDAFDFTGQTLQITTGSKTSFLKWYSDSGMATDATVYQRLKDLVDIDEYINYMAAGCYMGPNDWYTNTNNIKGFRSQADGRFHMVLFDLDSGFGSRRFITHLQTFTGNEAAIIFNNMMKNTEFKEQFITAYCIVDGSVFTDERTLEAANHIGTVLEKPLSFDGRSPWETCNAVVSEVKSGRNERINSLRTSLGLGNGSKTKIGANIAEARILIDNQPVPTSKFNGTLFAPFTLTASAPAGYNFEGWSKGKQQTSTIKAYGSQWSYYDQGSLDGTDWKTGTLSSSWKMGSAPLGFGKDDVKTTLDYGGDSNNKRPTYYFRSTVTLKEAPATNDIIQMNYIADDGFAVYINGIEAARYQMAGGTPVYNQYSSTDAKNNPDSGTITLDASLFHKGDNTIAVEVHNWNNTSSDIYWSASFSMQHNSGTELITDRTITINEDEECNFTAVFRPIMEECLIAAGSTPVVINEVSATNSIYVNEYYKRNDWIELYNTTDSPIDVAGMYISDDVGNPEKYQIPTGDESLQTIIPAHGHLIIWADRIDPMNQLHANFKLGNEDEACVLLTAADLSWSDRLTYMQHGGMETIGRYPDGGKRVYRMTVPTISTSNTIGSYAELLSGTDENFDEEHYMLGIGTTPDTTYGQGSAPHGVYDLQGRKVADSTTEALPKGIYIINGRKVAVK